MKRVYILLVVAVLAIVVSAAVLAAQESPAMPPPDEGQMGGMMGMGRMGMPAIAVSGNDVYVVSGGMLLKYDSELNLVKKAELPASERPMMGGGRMRGGGGMGMRGGGGGGRGGGMRRGGGM